MTIQSNAINLQYFQIFEKQRVWVISNADKIPMQVSGNPSKVNDPNTWETLENVHQYCNTHQNCLPAIILSDHLNLIFLDLDDVIDPNTQKIEVWAQEVIDSCNSYTERSKSGRGIHIFLHGQPPNLPSHEKLRCRPHKKHWDKKGEIELYFTKKAATITGDVIVDQPIRSISEDGLASLYRKFFPKEKLRNERTVLFSPKMSDEEVLRLARSSKNSIKFTNLYDHADWDGAKDRSAMDLSLANYLAFYTQDLEQINRLMLSSALLREKWERSDYLDRTIETAVKGLSSAYQSKRSPSSPIPSKQLQAQPEILFR
jgi:putative DNA primase/helicase